MRQLVILLVSMSPIALAQTATLTGVINDPDGGGVKDADIQG